MPRTKNTATSKNATPSPAEYAASHAEPRQIVSELLAAANAPPRNGPTHGAAQIANAPGPPKEGNSHPLPRPAATPPPRKTPPPPPPKQKKTPPTPPKRGRGRE